MTGDSPLKSDSASLISPSIPTRALRRTVQHEGVEVHGDSVAALTWARTERAGGVRVTSAAMVFTSACPRCWVDVKTATHISVEENYRCDELSRLLSPFWSRSKKKYWNFFF